MLGLGLGIGLSKGESAIVLNALRVAEVNGRSNFGVTANTSRDRRYSRMVYTVTRAQRTLCFSFDGWYMNSGDTEPSVGNSYTIEEMWVFAPNGEKVQATFSGSNTKTVASGDVNIMCDEIEAADLGYSTFAAGAEIWVKLIASFTTGGNTPAAYVVAGDYSGQQGGCYLASATTPSACSANAEFTFTGTAPATSSETIRPIMLGRPVVDGPSFIVCADSISMGATDSSANGKYGRGYVQRAMGNGGADMMPCLNFAKDGARADQYANNSKWETYIQYARFAIVAVGTNDLFWAGSLDWPKGQLASAISKLRSGGIEYIVQNTVMGASTSTDSWATLANQSALTSAFDSYQPGYNSWIYSKLADDTIDFVCDLYKYTDPSNGLRWYTNGTANYYTSDGIHPNATCFALMAQDLRDIIVNVGALTGAKNVVWWGHSLADDQDVGLSEFLKQLYANVTVVNTGISSVAMIEQADGGSSKYFVNSTFDGDGPSMTAALAASDAGVTASTVTDVIFWQGNQDASKIADATITASQYESGLTYFVSRLEAKYPRANFWRIHVPRRGSDVSDSAYQDIEDAQYAAFGAALTDASDLALRDLQHLNTASIFAMNRRVGQRLAAVDGKITFAHPYMGAATHTVNQITAPITGTGLLPAAAAELFKVFNGSTPIAVDNVVITGGNAVITTAFSAGNLPTGSLSVYNGYGQVYPVTNGGTDQTPTKIVRAQNSLPLERTSVTSTRAANDGTLKYVLSTCVMDLAAGKSASYPGTGTTFRDMIGGKEFTLTNFGYSSGKLTSTGTAYADDTMNVYTALLETLQRTDSAIPFFFAFDLDWGAATGSNSYAFVTTDGVEPGFQLYRTNGGIIRGLQMGDASQFTQLGMGTYAGATTNMTIGFGGTFSSNSVKWAVNSDTLTTTAFTSKACTGDIGVVPCIFSNTAHTQKMGSGAAIRTIALFSSVPSDSEWAAIRSAMIARR